VSTKARTGSVTGSKVPYMSNIEKIRTSGITGFKQVYTQEMGKVNIKQGNVDAGSILSNIFGRYTKGGVLGGGYQAVTDFWGLLLGTAEQKGELIGDLSGQEELGANIQDVLEDEFGTGGILINPLTGESKSFDLFGGIGKTLLIGAAVIGGLYLAGKYIGKKK